MIINRATLPPDNSPSTQPATEPATGLAGSELGGYRLLRRIAQGGMGEIYEGVHTKLDRRVAIKVIHPTLASRPEFLKRFEREAKASAALNHPNLVQVHDFDESNGRHFLVMEFVDGEDLSAHIHRCGKLEVDRALEIAEQTATALQAAARHSIIHRDIKPANLLLTPNGQIKLSDLGLAKRLDDATEVTATGVGIGSPHFLAPEQADDARSVDHRADIYSLGITLLYLLTARKPFDGATAFSVVVAHSTKPLPSGADLGQELPSEVETLIRRMAARNPDDRYPDYESLIEDIQRVRQGRKPALPQPLNPRESARARRTVTAVLGGAVVILLLAVLYFPKPPAETGGPGSGASISNRPPSLVSADPQERAGGGTPDPDFDLLPRQGPRGDGQPARRPPRAQSGQRNQGVSAPLRLVRPEPPTFPPNASLDRMLEVAAAFVQANPQEYLRAEHHYRTISRAAAGTPREQEVRDLLEAARERLHQATRNALDDFETKMHTALRSGNPQQAYDVWKDFPPGVLVPETLDAIQDILDRSLPPDFQPATTSAPQ